MPGPVSNETILIGVISTTVGAFLTFMGLIFTTWVSWRKDALQYQRTRAEAAEKEANSNVERAKLAATQAASMLQLHEGIQKNVELAGQAVVQAKLAYDEANTVNVKIEKLGLAQVGIVTGFNKLLDSLVRNHFIQGGDMPRLDVLNSDRETSLTPTHDALELEMKNAAAAAQAAQAAATVGEEVKDAQPVQ